MWGSRCLGNNITYNLLEEVVVSDVAGAYPVHCTQQSFQRG